MDTFRAWYVQKHDSEVTSSYQTLPISVLPENPVSIQVHYSSLNYKDALSARGLNSVTRSYPHVPGIDAAGVVVTDVSGFFKEGDQVIVTGHDLGTNTFGGFGEIIKVPADWVVRLPASLNLDQAMILGTAGFTALYGIHRLREIGISPESGPILVTGATGGVGSLSVFALANFGYQVIAATYKSGVEDFLFDLGAAECISSDELVHSSTKPLQPRKWAGTIETVGGPILDSVLKQTYPKGAVACCGNVLGISLNTNVLPFILRGIALLGIDSAFCAKAIRTQIWETAAKLPISDLPENYFKSVSIRNIDPEIDTILAGKQKGRVVISHK